MFLPLQDEICPDEDDFVRIFRNNARISAAGIPQIAAIMGNFVAGSAYLPIMCDKVLMTQGSGLYIAGPSLVKAAIGQQIDSEELREKIERNYTGQMDPRYSAARLWVDAIIEPHSTRETLELALEIASLNPDIPPLRTGVLQV